MEDSIFLLSALFIPGTKTQLGTTNRIFWEVTDGDFSKLPQFVEKYKDENLYFLSGVSLENNLVPDKDGVLIRKTPDSHIVKKHYFALDFDVRSEFGAEGHKISNNEIREMGLIMAKSLEDYHPAAIVFTGNGLHIYFIGDPIDPGEQYTIAVERIFTQFEKILGEKLDHANKNPGRILRLPGSFNNKKGKHAKVEVISFTPRQSRVYGWIPEIYDKVLAEQAAQRAAIPHKRYSSAPSGRGIGYAINDIPIEDVVCPVLGVSYDGECFHEPGDKRKTKGFFKSKDGNFVIHYGTGRFNEPSERSRSGKGPKGLCPYEFIQHHMGLDAKDTIEYFKTHHGIREPNNGFKRSPRAAR